MTTTTTPTTGGEIDAFCTKCQLNLAHTIIAMVGPKVKKVECNTCKKAHAYKGVQPVGADGKVKVPVVKKRATKAKAVVITWDERMASKDPAKAKKYSAKDTYKVDDVIDHPTLGLGIVSEIRNDKVDVAFKADDRTLIHGKGGGPTAQASFIHAKPGSVQMGTADKPPAAPPAGSAKNDSSDAAPSPSAP